MGTELNAVDLGAVVCILTFVLRGHRIGFVREILTFVGWMLGFGLSLRFMVPLAGPVARLLGLSIEVAGLVVFLSLFVLGVAPFWMAGMRIEKKQGKSRRSGLARWSGATVGLAQGVALTAFLLFVGRASPLVPDLGPKVDASLLGSRLAGGAKVAIEAVRSIGIDSFTRREAPPAS